MDDAPVLPTGRCPVCDAEDTYIALRADRNEYFVECLNCGVYSATRKAYRHFEYLGWRGDPAGLDRLTQLAIFLKSRPRGTVTLLDYDTWQSLLPTIVPADQGKPTNSSQRRPDSRK
jgi:hypothetical protein